MDIKERISKATKRQWIRMTIMSILTLLFVIWSGYYWVLLLLFFFFDCYITKFIPWGFWKKSKNSAVRTVMEWVDAIVFALIAVYFINTFFFQNYQIPTSSLEKSLLVGDFLFVSKINYGARSPMTPFSFPLTQHTLPFFNTKSYLEKPQVEYKRLAGLGSVKRGDIVVFNFPAGDTVASNLEQKDYYTLCAEDSYGREGVISNKEKYGNIIYRPVDRRENYVKRCIGLPGETIEIKNSNTYIDGKLVANPENMQLYYYVQTDGSFISESVFDELGISRDDYATIDSKGNVLQHNVLDPTRYFRADSLQLANAGFIAKNKSFGLVYILPLTNQMRKELETKPFILSVVKVENDSRKETKPNGDVVSLPIIYPVTYPTMWTQNNYGPLWIPKKGETIRFDDNVDFKVAAYNRCIRNYEGNKFEYRDGKVYINGKEETSYTFKYDYYFMMGDNRDNSADSRFWGFVPEDHIVGEPIFIWLSLDKYKTWFNGKIRWDRIFTSAKKK